MHGRNIRATKASAKGWIAHHLQAMEKFVDEIGLILLHLNNLTADTSEKIDQATLQYKFNTLIDVKFFLCAALLLDLLRESKIFSFIFDTNLIEIVNSTEATKRNYIRLLANIEHDKEYIFTYII